VGVGGNVTFTCKTCRDQDVHTYTDANGNLVTENPYDTVTYTWTDGGYGSFSNGGVGQSVTWTAPSQAGTYTVTVTVSDADGHHSSDGGSDDDTTHPQASRQMHVTGAPFATVWSACDRASSDESRYSGTRCTIGGRWYAGEGGHLTKVELWVDDICRWRQTWPAGTGPSENSHDEVPFSSTQFTSGFTMEMSALAYAGDPSNPVATSDPYSKIAWNQGYTLYNVQFATLGPIAAGAAYSSLCYMLHETSGVISTHTAQNIRDNIPNFGVFYTYSHGTETSFKDCIYPGGDVVTTGQVVGAVSYKNPHQCPYTFVFLDTCYSGTETFRQAFGATALLGWTILVPSNQTRCNWSMAVWDGLVARMTVDEAVDLADSRVPGLDGYAVRGDGSYRVHNEYSSL
jgi:hypothetical protein